MSHVLTALEVVLPVFLIIGIGFFLRWQELINDDFVHMAMKVVFNVCLPSMLFLKVSKADAAVLLEKEALGFAGFAIAGTFLVYFIARGVAKAFIDEPGSRGTFVQGSFRSNFIILGNAVLYNLFGDELFARIAILFIAIIPLYNVLSIWVLSEREGESVMVTLKTSFIKVIKNPLIISIVLAFIVSSIGIRIPDVVDSTLNMLGAVGTPLGLIGIGAYLNFKELETLKDTMKAAALKVVIFPIIGVGLALILGFSYIDTAIIFVLFGSPAAISSFIMATALGGNPKLAANIVIVSTGLSMVTYVIGLTILSIIF